MIEDKDIAATLGQYLKDYGPELPIAWAGDDVNRLQHPFLAFDNVPTGRQDDTLQGGAEIARGFVQITIMSEIGLPIWANTVRNANGQLVQGAGAIVSEIRALFPYAKRFATTGGEITITEPPEAMQGYPDGPHWRNPVKITYEAS